MLYSEVAGVVDINEASTWDGYLRSAAGSVAGTFLAKIGKAGKGYGSAAIRGGAAAEATIE